MMPGQPSSANIRQFLFDAFSDAEINNLCFDYFPTVHADFGTDMTKSRKIQLLLEYCQRLKMISNLLAAIQRTRPEQYDKNFPQAVTTEVRPESAAPARNPHRIFISHAHEDADLAHRLAADLQRQNWLVWITPDSIHPGEKWVNAIERGIDECGVFVLVMTPVAIKSRWVKSETSSAIALEHEGKVQFIPLQVAPTDAPTLWKTYQSISFLDGYEDGLQQLLVYLEQTGQPPISEPATVPGQPRVAISAALPEQPTLDLHPFTAMMLDKPRPASLAQFSLLGGGKYTDSPRNWAEEVLYMLLVDRFSDGQENTRLPLDRRNLAGARPPSWRWDRWAESGANRWQGGTLSGIKSKLGYLQQLGVTTLWLSPVFKQRGHLDTYHGYSIQDFLDIDPHFGTRGDLVDLVAAAHRQGMYVILDVVFNHSGPNWIYPPGTRGGQWTPDYTRGQYPFGAWLGDQGQTIGAITGNEEGVWPVELQDPECYVRAGMGNLGARDLDDPHAEHRRSDFFDLRKFNLSKALPHLIKSLKYWIALADLDGFNLVVLGHVTHDEATFFCESIKEYAASLGKRDFLLIAEIGGGDFAADHYLDLLGLNLNAALDIGEMRPTLNSVAKGLVNPKAYFDGFNSGLAVMGAYRNLGNRHVSMLDDQDHVFGDKLRFSSESASDRQVVVGVALQLFTLGIPCLYYGTEQALAGPERSEWPQLPEWGLSDRYLRETMFGPAHPRRSGRAGLQASPASLDPDLPGFGPFGTAGYHCFDDQHPAYLRMAQLIRARQTHSPLRLGRQYLREILVLGGSFHVPNAGELLAWSRILVDEEILCVVNPHPAATQSAFITVDSRLNPRGSSMSVILNTSQAAGVHMPGYSDRYTVGTQIEVLPTNVGSTCVEVRDIPPGEVLLLGNLTSAP